MIKKIRKWFFSTFVVYHRVEIKLLTWHEANELFLFQGNPNFPWRIAHEEYFNQTPNFVWLEKVERITE